MSIKSFFAVATNGSKKRSIDDTIDTTEINLPVKKTSSSPVRKQQSPVKVKLATATSSGDNTDTMSAEKSCNKLQETESLVVELTDASWSGMLKVEFEKTYFRRLSDYVDREYRNRTVFPPRHQVFNAFNWCSYDDIKVVIIGQDPYHGAGQAHGLAFSVARGVPPPPSLKNIYKVAQGDVNIPAPTHGCLEAWSRQGVLLLNACLTVRSGEANSHQNQGWEQFTDEVIRLLNRKENLVFLLWGKPAQAKCKNIDRRKHLIIQSSHPSPLGAYAKNEPFMQSQCFSKCNAGLEKFGVAPIDWMIPK